MKIYVANELKKLDVDISRKLFSIAKENKISFYPSPLQAKITKYLIENNKREVYQKELEEVFEVRKATISGVLFTMEKNEVIKRVASENDARQKKIVLTKKSKKIYRRLLKWISRNKKIHGRYYRKGKRTRICRNIV